MKTPIIVSGIFSMLFFFTSCTKTNEVTISGEQKVSNYLTGSGNRIWNLTNMYENSVEKLLTPDQKKNTKTYTVSPNIPAETYAGVISTTDCGSGTWALKGPAKLIELTQKNSVPNEISYLINEISNTKLDIEYTKNYKTLRYVYIAY